VGTSWTCATWSRSSRISLMAMEASVSSHINKFYSNPYNNILEIIYTLSRNKITSLRNGTLPFILNPSYHSYKGTKQTYRLASKHCMSLHVILTQKVHSLREQFLILLFTRSDEALCPPLSLLLFLRGNTAQRTITSLTKYLFITGSLLICLCSH
jgi:hypothetical protein